MPNTPSAKKDLLRNAARRQANRGKRSAMRTAIKQTLVAVRSGDSDAAGTCLPLAVQRIDKCVKWNLLHANTASRMKSKLARAVNSIG